MSRRNSRNLLLLQQIARNPFAKTVAPAAFDILSDFERDMEAVSLNRKLSAEGRQEEAQKHLRRAIRDLRDIQKPLEESRAKIETMRASIKLAAYDKADIVAAMNRRELRDASRAMSFGQRSALLSGPTRSKAFIDALLEFADDPWLAGVDVFNPNELQGFEAAKEERRRDLNGPVLDAIAEREAEVEEVVGLVINVVRGDIRADYGLNDFEAIAKEIESKAGAVWLRKDKDWDGNERIFVVDVQNHRSRVATPDEERDGVFFKDFSEYQASRETFEATLKRYPQSMASGDL
jgi:hypothetical protein